MFSYITDETVLTNAMSKSSKDLNLVYFLTKHFYIMVKLSDNKYNAYFF